MMKFLYYLIQMIFVTFHFLHVAKKLSYSLIKAFRDQPSMGRGGRDQSFMGRGAGEATN